jgi:aspartyl-tRNA(Asn)/glutamyl-tRNA(Gln) amidotransferase subunit A
MRGYSIRQLAHGLAQKEFSSVELTEFFIKQIQSNEHLNCFISLNEEAALAQARSADQRLSKNTQEMLTGIPMAHKDIFCTLTLPTTCGSKMLAEYISPYEATLVNRLNAAGAVVLGKTNMDEFAMGSANENSYFGAVKNPWDLSRVPGGSSGGSASAIAMGILPYATGSDTGGSIRQPAAFCGISGLKPTYGLISRYGMVAFASSLDQAGPMGRSVEDLAFVLQTMAGHDPQDSTSSKRSLPDYINTLKQIPAKIRVGVPTTFFSESLDPDIHHAMDTAIAFYRKQGAEIISIDFKLLPVWIPCYYILACAEASSNLSRYDGIRYGFQAANVNTLEELISLSRQQGFGPEVKRRILTGAYVLSAGYYDAYYLQAQKVRRKIQEEFLSHFAQVDVILGPTTPTCAFPLGEKQQDPTLRYLSDIYTVGANLAGLPALSIPAGFNSQGLPIGMQLMGPHHAEPLLLQFGHDFQNNSDWHLKIPDDKVLK